MFSQACSIVRRNFQRIFLGVDQDEKETYQISSHSWVSGSHFTKAESLVKRTKNLFFWISARIRFLFRPLWPLTLTWEVVLWTNGACVGERKWPNERRGWMNRRKKTFKGSKGWTLKWAKKAAPLFESDAFLKTKKSDLKVGAKRYFATFNYFWKFVLTCKLDVKNCSWTTKPIWFYRRGLVMWCCTEDPRSSLERRTLCVVALK